MTAPPQTDVGTKLELGYVFHSPALLAEALTHPSLSGGRRSAQRHGRGGYERLEFLGDRVLGLLVAEWLMECFPTEAEGGLAKRHVALVRRESLCQVAETLGLGEHLRLSPGEADSGGRHNRTILADACEALIGALYLDGGLEVARRFVHAYWTPLLEAIERPPQDGKTMLQEWAQGRGLPLPAYRIVERTGPAHRPEFEVAVEVPGLPVASGHGSSRRAAEQAAAAVLLAQLGIGTPAEPGAVRP